MHAINNMFAAPPEESKSDAQEMQPSLLRQLPNRSAMQEDYNFLSSFCEGEGAQGNEASASVANVARQTNHGPAPLMWRGGYIL